MTLRLLVILFCWTTFANAPVNPPYVCQRVNLGAREGWVRVCQEKR